MSLSTRIYYSGTFFYKNGVYYRLTSAIRAAVAEWAGTVSPGSRRAPDDELRQMLGLISRPDGGEVELTEDDIAWVIETVWSKNNER